MLRDIETNRDARGTAHPTLVDAKIKVIQTHGDDPIVQIDTFGSDARKIEGKVSQTLQFDRQAAEKLVEILSKAFRL